MTSIWLDKILAYRADQAIIQFQYLNIALACLGVYIFLRTTKPEIHNLTATSVLFIVLNFTINMMFSDQVSSVLSAQIYAVITLIQLILVTVSSIFLLCAYSFMLDQTRRL